MEDYERVMKGVSSTSIVENTFYESPWLPLPTIDDKFQYKFELLKQELETLHDYRRTYDGILFIIKGWAITVFSAFVLFTIDKQKPVILIFCAMAVILFWLLDSIYNNIQSVFILRYNQIEKFLKSPKFDEAIENRSFEDFQVPNIEAGFDSLLKNKYTVVLTTGIKFHNALLYVAMLILIVGLMIVL